jgi:predicted outer membrane repeat protein
MRRLRISVLLTVAAGACALLGAHPAFAAATCSATDTNDGFSSSDAQTVVDHALSGDTVTIAGTCGGVTLFGVNSATQQNGPTIDNSITLQGIGKSPTLQGFGLGSDAIVLATGPDTLTVNNLTLTRAGVGVLNSVNGTVTINDSTITNNLEGIDENSNGVTMTVNNTTISGNGQSSFNGGGIYNQGTGTVLLQGTTTVTKNIAAYGAGIYNDTGSTLSVLDSTTIKNNTASVDGGGIYNNHGTLNIASSAIISHNKPDNIVNVP